jgi:PhnB protein
MAKLNPYINFSGNCMAAFDFYKSVFGGEFAMVMKFGEVPEGVPYEADESDKIMHVSLPIGDGSILMGSDAPDRFGALQSGTNFAISIAAESKDEADRLYLGLSAGGKITMPIAFTFWGAYFAMFDDQFGISWMVNYDVPRS